MTRFSVTAFMLLICTAALLSTTGGVPKPLHPRCECIKTHSNATFPVNRILSLRVIPAGPQCRNEEVIATMKKGTKYCLDPEEKWVASLKEKFNKKSVRSQQ